MNTRNTFLIFAMVFVALVFCSAESDDEYQSLLAKIQQWGLGVGGGEGSGRSLGSGIGKSVLGSNSGVITGGKGGFGIGK